MKKSLSFFLFLVVGLGLVWGGAPVQSYKMAKSEGVAFKNLSESAVLFKIQQGDTLNGRFLSTTGSIELPAITGSQKPEARVGIGFSSAFPFGEKSFESFGVTGNGYVFFGEKDSVYPAVSFGNMSNLTNVRQYIYSAFATFSSENFQHIKSWEEAVVKAGPDTKVGYEEIDNSLYISFENISVLDTAGRSMKVSYQYRLDQDGGISMIVKDFEPMKTQSANDTAYYGFRWGLYGSALPESNWLGDWEGNAKVASMPTLDLNADIHPADGDCFSFSLPDPCVAIDNAVLTLEGTEITENAIELSFYTTWTEGEKALFILSEQATLQGDNAPQDGVRYTNDVAIGNSKGVCVGTMSGSYSDLNGMGFSDLESNTTYYLHTFVYSDKCSNGPLYGKAIVKEISTPLSAPESLTVVSVGTDSLKVKIGEMDGVDKYLVAVSEKTLTQYGTPAKNVLQDGTTYAEDQTIDYQGISLHVVASGVEGEVSVPELVSGKVYFVYAWSMSGTEGSEIYSPVYAEISTRTVSTVPCVYDFNSDQPGEVAAGWTTPFNETTMLPEFAVDMYGESGQMFASSLMTFESAQTMRSSAVSPLTDPGEYDSVAGVFRIGFYLKDWMGEISAYHLQDGDSAVFQWAPADSEQWTTVGKADKSTSWETDGFASVSTRSFIPGGAFRFRVLYYRYASPEDMSAPTFAIENIAVEPSLPCKYPVNITVEESEMGYGSALLRWEDGNSPWAGSFIVRYRLQDGGDWMVKTTPDQELQIEGMESASVYVAEVSAVCGAADTSLTKSVEFRTLSSIPYGQDFTAITELPVGYRSLKGELAVSGTTELRPVDPYQENGWALQTTPTYDNSIGMQLMSQSAHSWLLLPTLVAGQTGTARLSFDMMAYLPDVGGRDPLPADGIENDTLKIFMSEDGNFSAASVLVGSVVLDSLKTTYRTYDFEFSVTAGSKNIIGFYFAGIDEDPENYSALSMDSIRIGYASIECPAVTDIRQAGLTKTGVTISWKGSAEQYAILFKKRNAAAYDTVYTQETSYTFNTLASGTQYAYQILGYCNADRTNASELSPVRYFTTIADCLVPADLTVVDVSWQSVTLACRTDAPSKVVNIYAQDLETYPSVNYIARWNSRDTIEFTGLIEYLRLPYYAKVRAVCGPNDSSAWSEPVAFTTTPVPPCGVPVNLSSAIDLELGTATLTWEAGANNDETRVYWKKADAAGYDTAYAYSDRSYILRNLEAEQVYNWRLQAICDEYFASPLTGEQTFKMENVGVESVRSYAESMKVRVTDCQIIVENADRRYIDMLEVYSVTGKLLKRYWVKSDDNVLVRTDLQAGVVLINVVGSGTEKAVFKTVVL